MPNLRSYLLFLFVALGAAMAPCAARAQQPAADADAALKAAALLFDRAQAGQANWQDAIRAFEDFKIRFPQHPQAVNANFNIAEAREQLGEYDQARTMLAEYYDVAPDEEHKGSALFRIGECSFFLNEFDRARRDLELFRSKYPNHEKDPFAIDLLGDIYLEPATLDAPAAEALYQKGLEKYKNLKVTGAAKQREINLIVEKCRLGLGRAQAAAGKTPQAIATLKKMADDAQNPLAADARIRLGRLYYDAQRYGEAIDALKPFEKAAKGPNRNWGLYWMGRSYLDRNQKTDTQSAVTALKAVQIPKEDPDEPPVSAVAYFLGEAYRAAGQYKEAVGRFELTFYDYADSEWADDAFLGAMRVAMDQQDFKKVTGDYLAIASQSFSSSPLYPDMDQLVGQAFLKTEKYKDAQITFTQLTEKYPRGGDPQAPPDEASPPTTFTNDNWLFLALAEIGLKKPEKALAALKKIEPTTGEDSADFVMAVSAAEASANVNLGKYQDAIAPLQAYLKVRSNDFDAPHYLEQLAHCQIMVKQPAAAQKTIEQLRNLDPDDVGGVENILKAEQRLAVLAAKQKEKELARSLYTLLTFRDNPQTYKDFGEDGLARLDAGKPPVDGANVVDAAPVSGRAEEQAAFALFKEGLRQEQLGDPNTALESFVTVYTDHASTPEAPKALLAAGRILDRGTKDAEAAKLLRRLVDEYADFPQLDLAWYRLGWTLVESGDLEGGQDAFAQIVKSFPESTLWSDAAYRIAEYQSASKRRDEANRLLDDILRESEKTDSPTRLLDHVLYLRAQNALLDHKWTVVEQLSARLLKETPESPLVLSAQYLSAEAAYKSRDWQTAHDRFTALEKKTQGRTETWLPIVPLRLAQILAWNKQWPEALAAAEDIQQTYPRFERMHEVDYLMGRCLTQQAKYSLARKHFENAIDADAGKRGETAAMSKWMIGETYFRQGKTQENYKNAINAYDEVQSRYRYPYWQSVALLQMAKCYLQLGNPKKSEEILTNLVSRFPSSPYAAEAEKLRKSTLTRSAVTQGSRTSYR